MRDTRRGLLWLAIDLVMAAVVWNIGLYIDPTFRDREVVKMLSPMGAEAARWERARTSSSKKDSTEAELMPKINIAVAAKIAG